MANKDMERLVISGLDANNYILTPDTTLSKDGVPADAGAVGDALEEVSEDIEGFKEDLSTLNSEGTVPTSEQMLSDNYTEDSVPYHFRKTASDNADREELEIVGGSVAWNQFCYNGDLASSTGWAAQQGTLSIANGVATLTKTSAASSVSLRRSNASYPDAIGTRSFIGHVYYASAFVKTPKDTAGCFYIFNALSNIISLSANVEKHIGGIVKLASASEDGINVYYDRLNAMSLDESATIRNVMLFDLTAMFGSTIADHIYALEQATAGAGVSLFRSLFPKDYYAYDAGSMQSVSGLQSHKTVGFNQWDEEWENGIYLPTTGAPASDNNYIRGKNRIKIAYGKSYHVSKPSGKGFRVLYYDALDSLISNEVVANAWSEKELTIPSDAAFIRFYCENATYNHDICINLSDSAKNGTYEPYDGHSYALDDSLTLRGIPTLVDGKIKWDGDIYPPSGKVARRYAIANLGTFTTWHYSDGGGTFAPRFYVSGLPIKSPASNQIVANAICQKLVATTDTVLGNINNTIDNAFAFNSTGTLYVKCTAYTDEASFKAAMSNVYMVYELATPTTEQADPYIGIQSCDPNGTEEFVSTGIVPVGHNTKYPDNMRAKLDGLPWNFASLIAPTESGFKATRNYTTGQLLIVNNVLYKATANIANGATITPNTNVTATTLAEVIAALS